MFSYFVCSVIFFSVRLRKNSSIRKSEDVGESKKGQRLIEKETMETGKVIQVIGLPRYLFQNYNLKTFSWAFFLSLISRWSSRCSSSTCVPWAGDIQPWSSWFTSPRTLLSLVRTCGWVTGPMMQWITTTKHTLTGRGTPGWECLELWEWFRVTEQFKLITVINIYIFLLIFSDSCQLVSEVGRNKVQIPTLLYLSKGVRHLYLSISFSDNFLLLPPHFNTNICTFYSLHFKKSLLL